MEGEGIKDTKQILHDEQAPTTCSNYTELVLCWKREEMV